MRKLTFYLILAVILSSCGKTDTADPIIISSIQTELQIDLANPFEGPPKFAFRLSTLEEKCENAQILADGAIQGQNAHIAVSGLLVEPNCPGLSEKVRKDVFMNLEPGVYDFSLAIGEDLLNTGVLSFDGDVYNIDMHSTLGIKIGHSELYKIPDGIIWGAISGDESISEITQEFISELHPFISEIELKEGYYGHFTMQNSDIQNLTLTEEEVLDFNHLFVYQLDGDINALQLVLNDFRAQYGSNINISCSSWKGDTL